MTCLMLFGQCIGKIVGLHACRAMHVIRHGAIYVNLKLARMPSSRAENKLGTLDATNVKAVMRSVIAVLSSP